MKTSFSIVPLSDTPKSIPLIAQWIFDEWGKFDPHKTLEKTIQNFQERAQQNQLPIAFTALVDGSPVGTVSLKFNAMKIRPELNPWVGSLFVLPNYRKNGIGSALIEHALRSAKEREYSQIFLWTEVAEDFYQRFGFSRIEVVRYLDQDAKVMSKALS